jgi:hypothetical protein
MRRRLPATWKGRRQEIHSIPKELPCVNAEGAWLILQSKKADGKWYEISSTRDWKESKLKRTVAAVMNRAWYAGYEKNLLIVIATLVNGICFRWESVEGDPDTFQEVQANRQTRLAHRRAWSRKGKE